MKPQVDAASSEPEEAAPASEPRAKAPPPAPEPPPGPGSRPGLRADEPRYAPDPAWRAQLLGWRLVVGIALVVRLAYFLTAHGPAFEHPIVDADYYDHLGTQIAGGEGFPSEPFWQPPFYPLVVGWLYKLFGHTLWAPRILQAALGAAAAALCCEAARRLTGKAWAGVAAGLLVALHGTLVFYDGELLPTSLAVFVAALVLWGTTCLTPTDKVSAGLGAAVGLGALAVAPLVLLLAPAAWAMASGRSRRPLYCVAAALAVIAPVTLMNHARSGEWIFISANGGVNLWIGNNPEVDRTMAIRPGADWEALVGEPEHAGISGAGAQSDYFVAKAARWCASAPAACAKNLAWKARLLVASRDLPRNEDLYVAREQSPVLAALTARAGGVALPYVLLWPLAVAGAVVAVLQRRRDQALVVAAAVALAAPSVLFFVTGRYRAPLVPALAVLAALFLVELSAPRVKPAWAPLAAGLGALVLAALPVRLALDRVNFRAEVHYAVGGRLARLGDHEGAAKALREALDARSDYLEAAYNLALELEQLDRYPEAVAEYDRILRRNPTMLEARARRAEALVGAGDLVTAEKAFGEIARDTPDVPAGWIGLAHLALMHGDLVAAESLTANAEKAAGGPNPETAALREQIRAKAPR